MPDDKPTNKERVKEIVKGIEDGIKNLFQSEKYADYLRTMSRFHTYSVNNTILIHQQMPNATKVAGFQKWKKQFGRHVMRGESGITILAPTPFKKKVEEMKLDPDTNLPVLDEYGQTVFEEKVIEIPMFKPVKVFDVSQTEGKPLPQLCADLTGNVQQYEAFMEALRRTSPVPIEIKAIPDKYDGLFMQDAQKILVRSGMSEVMTVCATIHEIGHSLLHNRQKLQMEAAAGTSLAEPKQKDENTKEVEAESVSYAVCQYYGIETAGNSFGYIALWSQDRTLPELRDSLETITKTANTLISGIDKNFAEVCKERGIALPEKSEEPTDRVEQVSESEVQPESPGEPEASAPVEEDTPERFSQDYCDYLERLHHAGIVEGSSTPKDELAAQYASEVLRHGSFEGAREELSKVVKDYSFPDAIALLERLEKLSDAWDTTLRFELQPYPIDDGTGPRCMILAFEPGKEKAREAVFVGPAELGKKLLQELADGTTTARQVRALNQQILDEEIKIEALIYASMSDQEALLLVNGAQYLHIQVSGDAEFDYSLYDAETMRLQDGGRFGVEKLGIFGIADPIEAACWRVYGLHGIVPADVKPVPLDTLETIQEANMPQEPEREAPVENSVPLPDTALDEYPLPDSSMREDALESVGYLEGDLLPVGSERACELLEQDMTVYTLRPGENPEMAFDTEEIQEQPKGTLFAVPREEWEASPAFQKAVESRMERQEEREAAFLNHAGDCFAIYQLRQDDDLRFVRYETLKRLRKQPERANYELVYTVPLPEGCSLGRLWDWFNADHPADYRHPSMSVSDIVALKQNGVVSYHYCDSIGFKELPDFNKPDNYLKTAELSTEDDANMIDGVINNGQKQPTVAELEAQVKAGQTISILDLYNANIAEHKKKSKPKQRKKRESVLAKLKAPLPKQPQNEQKAAPKKSARKER